MERNLCKRVLSEGGKLIPLMILAKDSKGLGLMNPSILIDGDKILLNIRNINYTLYHCEGQQLFNNRWGPLSYLHPENDIHLRTWNFMCELSSTNLEIDKYWLTDTSTFDVPPKWDFVGLEDARLFRWDGKLYQCGVRRDTTPNGQGRMELSEILIKEESELQPNESKYKEISRTRIEPPGSPTYCEKNWMPVLDMPYHFVKWTNPTQVVKVNLETKTSETIFLSDKTIPNMPDFRGGSQVINYKDYRICLIHEVNLMKNKLQQKDATYKHRFIVWDKNWNIVKMSDSFSFMDGEIEFTCGMAFYKEDLLLTFGFQDNAAFLLKVPKHMIDEIIGLNINMLRSIDNAIKKNKFEDFPPAYYVSFIDSQNRREILEKQFEKYNITAKAIISTKESDKQNIVNVAFKEQLNIGAVECTVSHLKAIKEWYDNSTTSYALFFEDDALLETSENWNFTWKEFMNNLPRDWDCVQLCTIRKDFSNIKLRKRKWDDWSITAYIITRKYAKQLLDQYYNDGIFNLKIKDENVLPLPENIIYLLGKTYVLSLFTENPGFKTTFKDRENDKEHLQVHEYSSKFVIDWWKNNGKSSNIKDLMKIGYSQLYQDEFVLSLFDKDYKGTYVDIGCQLPDKINNTLLLEENGWRGVSIDIENYTEQWKKRRGAFVIQDALTCDYPELFEFNKIPKIVDYLNLDIEGDGNRFAALKRVMESGYEFKIITIEHDAYRGYDVSERLPQRKLLHEMGYVLLCADVFVDNPKYPMEDWWINPKHFEESQYFHYKCSKKSGEEIVKYKI